MKRGGALALLGAAVAMGACLKPEIPSAADLEYRELMTLRAVSISGKADPARVNPGEEVSIAAVVTSSQKTTVDVRIEVWDSDGRPTYATSVGDRPVDSTTQLELMGRMKAGGPGTYSLAIFVTHTATGKSLFQLPGAARFTVQGAAEPADAGSENSGTDAGGASPGDAGGTPSGPCAGSPLFCDDFTLSDPPLSYLQQRGTWTWAEGAFAVADEVAWERARALVQGDYSDFDVTLVGRSLGDAGFGLSYGAQSTDDGFAVMVHPAQFQGVYLKELRPGQQDVNQKSYPLPAPAAGKAMTLRVRRAGTAVTVWLNGAQILSGDDGGVGRHGRLGLILSVTDQTAGSGAEFSLLRLDSASPVGAGRADAGAPSVDAGAPSGPPSTDGSYTVKGDLPP